MKPTSIAQPPCSGKVAPLAGREGRLPTGDFVPVTEFGLRGRRQ